MLGHPAVENCEISWDANDSQFAVELSLDLCRYCSTRGVAMEVVKRIPVVIAEKSKCACGANLVLKNHSLRLKDDYVEFQGQYACESCGKSNSKLINRIGEGLSAFWKTTKKIKIGVKGMKYENEGTSEKPQNKS